MPVTGRQLFGWFGGGCRRRRDRPDRPAIASSEPIKIGFLPALTGPSSSTGIAINRGTRLAVEEIMARAASIAASSI